MQSTEILSQLVNEAYRGCSSSTLANFISGNVQKDPVRPLVETWASKEYIQFLDNLFVAYPTKIAPERLCLLERQDPSTGEPFVHTANTLYSKVTGDISSEVESAARNYPVFDKENWNTLCGHVGPWWIGYLTTFCSMFVVTRTHSLFHFHDGPENVPRSSEITLKRKGCPGTEQQIAKRGPAATIAAPPPKVIADPEDEDLNYFLSLKKFEIGPTLKHPALDLPWAKLLYNKSRVFGFSDRHQVDVLSKNLNDSSGKELALLIFRNTYGHYLKIVDEAKESNGVARVLPLLRAFLVNHRRSHFRKMVEAHCGKADASPFSPSSPLEIGLLLSGVINRVVPKQLLGSNHNKKKLSELVMALVRVPTIYSRPTAFKLLSSFRVKDCSWFPPDTTYPVKRQMTFSFLRWFICDYLFSTFLPAFFYVTERQGGHKRPFYYLKARFRKMTANFIEQQIEHDVYEEVVGDSDIKEASVTGRTTVATVRLIPKETTLRPVVNVRRTVNCREKSKVRFAFEDHLRILQHLASMESYRGCSLLEGDADFIQRWRQLVTHYGRHCENHVQKQLYFVKFDVKCCFESMLHRLLTDIVERLIADPAVPEWWYRRSYKKLKFDNNGQPRTTFRRVVLPSQKGLLEHALEKSGWNTVMFAENTSLRLSKKMLGEVIVHIKNIILLLDRRCFRLNRGVCQGDQMSPILCNLYYSDFERRMLGDFGKRDGELFVRYTDDYLFVTSDKTRASQLLDIVYAGKEAYNFSVNANKSMVNFDYLLSADATSSSAIKRLRRSKRFIWKGLHFNTRTLEVNVDYHTHAGVAIGDRMALDTSQGIEGLLKKMYYFCSVRQVTIVFDEAINSQNQVVVNLYHFALMNALRFDCMVKQMPSCIGPSVDPGAYAEVVRKCVRRVRRHLLDDALTGRLRFSLRSPEISWICLQAFLLKMRFHSDRYRHLLTTLDELSTSFRSKVTKKKQKRWNDMLKFKHMPIPFAGMSDFRSTY